MICLSLRTSLCYRSYYISRRSASSWNILYFEKKAHGNFNVQSRPFIAKAAVETCRRTSLAFEAWKPELHIHMYYTVVVYSTTYVVRRSSHLCLFRSFSAATPLTQYSKTAIMIRKFEKGKFLNFEIFFALVCSLHHHDLWYFNPKKYSNSFIVGFKQ